MIKQIILYFVLNTVYLVNSPAQEVVTGLPFNSILNNNKEKEKRNRSLTISTPLEIPFFDDFSRQSVYPDGKKWLDNFVFINNTYSDRQITIGMATFDALDNNGRLYETASSSNFLADYLTSQPINLNYSASDNIWLSFFYQAGGLGDSPEANDSLTLQFFAPDENRWYSVWKAEGSVDQRFKPAIIKVDNSRYLKKGFQFRFINYASLSANLSDPSMVGNSDIWNVDYVLLNKNRNAADTVFADVAFRLPVRSLLKSHEAMPWKQFKSVSLQEMGSSIGVHYRNNDVITRNVTRDFGIRDVFKNSLAYSFSAGATNIAPLTNVDYKANLIYTFNSDNPDSARFKITCSLKTDQFDPKENDTIVYYQNFQNYFAFDDGTAEGGYGINGLGSRNAMLAYRFKSFIQDTIRALRICFNDSYLNSNKRAFDLMVWDDNNGIPGNVIYSKEEVMVEQGNQINGFYSYSIPEGVMVNDIFYIGWKQRSETFLNAGFDVNTPNGGKQFFWLNGEWQQSQVNGSVMIRPVVGNPIKTTSVKDIYYHSLKYFNIWPNPATDYININTGEMQLSGSAYVSIIDIYGRELMKVPFSEQVNISSLHDGIYTILIYMNGRPVSNNRIIKTRY
jgi:hypothetical protein